MKTYFSEGKLMIQLGTPPPPHFSENPPPLSTNPPVFEQFFHDPLLCPNFKNKKPSLILGEGGRRKLCKGLQLYLKKGSNTGALLGNFTNF